MENPARHGASRSVWGSLVGLPRVCGCGEAGAGGAPASGEFGAGVCHQPLAASGCDADGLTVPWAGGCQPPWPGDTRRKGTR
jgi:hypothetical protein